MINCASDRLNVNTISLFNTGSGVTWPYILIVFLILCSLNVCRAQDYLLKAVNQGSKQVIFIKPGSRIKAYTLQRDKVKGKLTLLNDSALIIGKDSLYISQINYLKKGTSALASKKANQVASYVFIGAGTLAYSLFSDHQWSGLNFTAGDLLALLGISAAGYGLGFIINELSNKTKDTYSWDISIVKNTGQLNKVKMKYKYSWFGN